MTQIRAGIDQLAGEDRSGWTSGSLSERLTEAMALRQQLDARILRITGEWDRSRAWEADGALTPVSWLTHRLPVSRTRAQEQVRTARFLERHDRAAKAVANGDVSVEHINVLSRVANDQREHLLADHADALLDAAEVLTLSDFAKVARRWATLADDELASADFMEQHLRRRLTIAQTFHGAVHGDLLLDPEGGALFQQAIDLLSPPDPADTPDGPRTAAQRRADALVEMSRIILQGAEGTGVSPTNINTLVDSDTLAGHGVAPPASKARCDADWAGPIGRETLYRISCDCSIARVVMKGRSEILNMGRKNRLVTSPQRRALEIRDDGCVFPGCERPHSWCDAHHLEHWARDGGPTDLGNLALLCRRHHVLVHEGGWTLTKEPTGGFDARAPDY
ncbi:MAG: DUF222 domain-containing protein [Acidimicrobiia bacterium]|nr:DUF222 domain-containing protein [Acidimicrobiia bacterium]